MTPTAEAERTVAERSRGFGLRALNRLAGSDILDRIRLRRQVERAVFQGTKSGFRSATVAGRTFKAAQKLGKPARQARGRSGGLFDLTPDEEQQMIQEAGRAFAAEKIRPAALEADAAAPDPARAARPGRRAGGDDAGRPRGARRRMRRARGGDQRR